ncbi:MAG TPA: M23 family metallopeptidase [Glycomyces sp.]|nr:M23 family metallopeptidase [Glycomyces sp.]
MSRIHRAMVLMVVTGALLAAGANLWPMIAEADRASAVESGPSHAVGGPGASPPRPAIEAARGGPGRARAFESGDPGPLEDRPGAPVRAGRWEAPAGPVDAVTRFSPPPWPWMPGHRGVDLAAQAGRPVVAAGPGTVVFAGELAGRGVVSIDHPGGLRTTYEPVVPIVARDEAVTAGQAIGHLATGHASCPEAACLHLGLKRGAAYLDPLLLFGSGQVRLLPRPTGEAP